MKKNSLYIDLLSQCISGNLNDSIIGIKQRLFQTLEGNDNFPGIISIEEVEKAISDAEEKYSSQLQGKDIFEVLGPDMCTLKKLWVVVHNNHHSVTPHTLCTPIRINNLRECAESVLETNIPGDFLETGTWKGGLSVFMRGILAAFSDTSRNVWVADSFEGLPEIDPNSELKDLIFSFILKKLAHNLSINFDYVKNLFHRYHLLDGQVKFIQGWFHESLPKSSITCLSLIRLDGDYYESTAPVLEFAYPKLSQGGYIIIDDYGLFIGCRRAVDEYRLKYNINTEMHWVDEYTVYWQKE